MGGGGGGGAGALGEASRHIRIHFLLAHHQPQQFHVSGLHAINQEFGLVVGRVVGFADLLHRQREHQLNEATLVRARIEGLGGSAIQLA